MQTNKSNFWWLIKREIFTFNDKKSGYIKIFELKIHLKKYKYEKYNTIVRLFEIKTTVIFVRFDQTKCHALHKRTDLKNISTYPIFIY